jgi:TonB family protein
LTVRPRPLGGMETWMRSSDYPQGMLKGGKQGMVSFRLSIDANGTPTACEVQRSYNDKQFDDVTCAVLMRRARFSPALDANGQAAPSYYLNTVRWVIPT